MSLTRKAPGKLRTICEVHREMYRLIEHLPNNQRKRLEGLLREAFKMGKKMTNKLRQYKHNYDDGWWEVNRLAGGEIEDVHPVRIDGAEDASPTS